MAKARKKVAADRVQVTHLDGVNHLLVPAKTGDVEEYPQLAVKTVDPRVAKTVVEWLAAFAKPYVGRNVSCARSANDRDARGTWTEA